MRVDDIIFPSGAPETRASRLAELVRRASALPADELWRICFKKGAETRRAVQNRLLWVWNGAAGKAHGYSPDYAHAVAKFDILLPMMLSWEETHERAAFVSDVLEHVPARKHRLGVAHDMLRSSDLSVGRFAEWLSEYQRAEAEHGVHLTSSEDDLDKALGRPRRARAA